MSNDPSNQPEIIVDEDWKTQVEREKQEGTDSTGDEASTGDEHPESNEATEAPLNDLPPANFEIHISAVATQALMAMGQLPDAVEGQPEINLEFAKFQIDMLAMLQEKTKGNLSKDEAEMLEAAIHQLRMLYVSVRDR